jgi:DNA-binding NarL/FixJ family response regulator
MAATQCRGLVLAGAANGAEGLCSQAVGTPPKRSMQRPELTIYIVEDSPAVMERLVEAVYDIPNARVVGSAEAVASAIEGVRIAQPRVLILDVQLRDGSGFRLLKRMRAEGISRPETVIIVTNYPNDDYRNASRECGADHFFDKGAEFEKVRDVLLRLGEVA